jgi:hypothetical protein
MISTRKRCWLPLIGGREFTKERSTKADKIKALIGGRELTKGAQKLTKLKKTMIEVAGRR